ncbi:MAG: hypothetical protein ACRDY6_00370 [Acidimicrobiia bacterium]
MRVRMLVAVAGLVGLSTALMGATPAGAGPSGDEETFCEAVVDISVLFNRVEEEPTPKQQRKIDRLLGQIEENTPSELAQPVSVAAEAVRTGNFDDPAVQEAISTIDTWVADNCGYEVVDVTATEYQFEGIPEALEAGTTLFRFTNEGAELHDIGIARIKGDESIEEILALPEEEAQEKAPLVAFGFATQGQTSIVYTKLTKAGTYGAACFVPVGATSPETAETAEGPPHFMEGMTAEFEVTK